MFFPEGFLWLRITQRNDLNRGLSRLENELHENRKAIKRLRREKVVPRNRQCPFCGGELAGEFSRCKNCGGEVAWVNTPHGRLPCKPGQEGLLIEQIEQVVREQNLKQEQQEAKVWTKCPACDKKHQVSPNERHSRCSTCKDKVSGEDVLALIVGCLVLLAIVASPFAFWFYWDPRGAAATTKWLWGGTRFLLFWGGLIVVSFFGLMASIAFISGRKTGGEPLVGGSPLDPPRESVAPLTPDQLRPAAWIANGLAAQNKSVEEQIRYSDFWVRRGNRVSKPFDCATLLKCQRDGLLIRGDEVALSANGPWIAVSYEVVKRK